MTHPRARSDVILRPLGEEWILYDPTTRDLHVLNVPAALTWSHLDGTRSAAEIAEAVRSEVGRAPDGDRLRADVEAAIEAFGEAGLLE